jgi:hypothetical protein
MPGEPLRPEDIQILDQPEPGLFRFRVLLREDHDPAVIDFVRANCVTQVEDTLYTQPINPLEPEPLSPTPQRSAVCEARLGPLEIKLDFGPFMKVLDRLHTGYQHLVEKLAGPELMQLIEDITEHRKKPTNDFEHMIARTLLGPTRFDRINEDD